MSWQTHDIYSIYYIIEEYIPQVHLIQSSFLKNGGERYLPFLGSILLKDPLIHLLKLK